MDVSIDRVIIAVPDLIASMAQYEVFFGVAPTEVSLGGEQKCAWLALENTLLELQERPIEKAYICGLVFASSAVSESEQALDNNRQLELSLCDGRVTGEFRKRGGITASELGVDHIVLRTADAEASVDLFRDTLGIRLALDKTVPEWGGRMLFFRPGKLTLEVIQAEDSSLGKDYFWGIAFQCSNVDTLASQLGTRGVTTSLTREGRKPGTRVLTVKSHTLEIPTLLIGPAEES